MKTKRNNSASLALAIVLMSGAVFAGSQNGFRVTEPAAFPIFNTSTPTPWAASNGVSVVWTAGGSGNTTSGYPKATTGVPYTDKFRLVESAIGSPFEHITPEYYLGDQLVAPSNVNWDATFVRLVNTPAFSNNAVFYDTSVPGIFLSEGGLVGIDWILNDGTTNSHSYQVSGTPKDKPYRIYWTDEPFNGPPIDLSGKFVKFFGNPAITIPVYGLVTNYAGGMPSVISNVVKGLFLDPATHWLKAIGQIQGRVILAYYSTGNYDNLLGTIVVEVCGPDLKTMPGYIGRQLEPTGDGYNIVGLSAMVTEGMNSTDDVGDYVYQHKGKHSYSPKNGNLYAIRKNVGEPWLIEVYWKQQDLMGVSWPFEVLNYECDWPADAEQYVRGNVSGTNGIDYGLTVPISSTYTPTLMEFQEPDGHAILNNSVFSTKETGYSLLKLTGTDDNGDDNIWFVPVQSIWRDEPQFDLMPGNWPVGIEVAPLPTAIALEFDGTAGYLQTDITNELSGSFTVEGHFQIDETGNWQKLFFKNSEPNSSYGWTDFQVEVSASGMLAAILGSSAIGTNAWSVTAPDNLTLGDGTWHHIALVYDQSVSNGTLYLDGVPTSAPLSYPRPTRHVGALYVGIDPTQSVPFYLNGKVDDIRVWSRALTATEIQSGSVGFLDVAGVSNLIAYYPIENGVGRVAMDASGQGHDALMVNCIRVAAGAVGLSDMDSFSKYHGYIYEAVSGDNYNPSLYTRPDAMSSSNGAPASSGTNETYIFAVNKTPSNGLPLEVWWSHEVSQEAMPDPLWFPAWVQRYQFQWLTNAYSIPQIVLASQLGSANLTLSEHGAAVDFSRSQNSRMKVDDGNWFAGDTYTVECWVKPNNLKGVNGQVFDFNNGNSGNRVALQLGTDGAIRYTISFADGVSEKDIAPDTSHKASPGVWNHLALVVSGGAATVYLNGKVILLPSGGLAPSWSDATTNNYLAYGVYGGAAQSFDGEIDDFRIWGVARASNEVFSAMLIPVAGSEPGLRLCYSFDADIVSHSAEASYVHDLVSGLQASITYADFMIPGAPQLDRGIVVANEAPFVYYQNDPTQAGYNPNEEHAFVQAGSGGYVTYALRCDLNEESSSDPYVLVQYKDPNNNGRPKMQLYEVVATSQMYTQFAGTMTAGTLVPGPHPLDLLPDPWNTNTYWRDTNGMNSTMAAGYRDRKSQIWAKRAGPNGSSVELPMYNFYPMQDGFFFPSLGTNQPDIGTPVPWLCRLTDVMVDVRHGDPVEWTWTVEWPAISPGIDIGQTLTKAALGLPEVWSAKSMMMIYEPHAGSVALYDPVVIQSVGLEFEGSFADYFGFDSGPHGNIQQKNGQTFFSGVPPNVSDRFYFDPSAPKSACLRLEGQLVEPAGGLSYLQLNVLSDEERVALQGLAGSHSNEWSEAIRELATSRVNTTINTPASPYDSIAKVNYALTHMGPGAGGFVTLIENDARNKACGVSDGDPIQMHIIQLSSNLYAGALLPLEDPNNLLSEQLDILYTESFAGNASDFEFQWKRAHPNANGSTPTDYTNQYDLYRSEKGLTRFTVGKQGDTLPDMVNNFYVMRYRATPTSEVYAVTGDTWSGWVAPTLAEGWVQRVLNSVTPFTQRMQDLYDNPAETQISMIQQAGPPYEGDVALNQDNLTSVGLIQLYQTILNKAESMSLTLGINNTAANQQLMLAATRLNDLYMLLGNEAYADAMDPTIGFGSDCFNSDDFSLGAIDYGSLHSSLFCFDNLVPTLRDEELALLRGRSDQDQLAPSLQLSPAYNRLYWNFTKGITAGEVAYAVNYQIMGNDPTIDQPQAAAMYPQGHGDAWGHYLSALTGYYRLMRNPWFSWGTPSISPMIVGSAVVDADYYDEEKFAESAAALARTGAEVVKRSCEKAYVENDGTALAGYLDTDNNRAFGYGEWGARAGLAALYNWAAANSLLPPEVTPGSYSVLTFATNTQLACLAPPREIDFSSDFTFEFKVKPGDGLLNAAGNCVLFDWHSSGTNRSEAGAISLYLNPQSSNLFLQVQGVDDAPVIGYPAFNAWTHVAFTYSATALELTIYLNGVLEGVFSGVYFPDATTLVDPVIILAANDSPLPFQGSLSEFRIWNTIRTPSQLVAARDGVSANADGLLMYQRFIADPTQSVSLPDEACIATWTASNPVWQEQSVAGVTLNFTDDSILRINRASVGSLAEVTSAMKDVQRNVDLADAGMTPIGLSDNAIPFDIDPIELANGNSHFEQILARSEQALDNAATLLDRAQTVSKLQRQQVQSASNMKQDLMNEEAAMNTELIGIFGYPYSADIGAGGTYPQGYDGPDLYHYMWMDLESYGFNSFELTSTTSTVFNIGANALLLNANTNDTMTIKFELSSNGMIVKPDEIQGTRRAQGRLQGAYGSFVQSYLAYRKALATYDEKAEYCKTEAGWAGSKIGINAGLEAAGVALEIKEFVELLEQNALLETESFLAGIDWDITAALDGAKESVPSIIIAGLAVGTDIGAPIKGAMAATGMMTEEGLQTAQASAKLQYAMSQNSHKRVEIGYQLAKDLAKLTFESHEAVAEVEKLIMEANEAAMDLDAANAALINAQESFTTVLGEGEELLSKRERLRKQAVNRIAAGRYQDMAFRTFRSDALANYGNAFDLAKKYTYLATKAYDYETALGLGGAYSSDPIFREIVGARTIGFVENGEAQLGGIHGDGGLADILARLKANWLVLKGRLGINNPENEQCWLSLRTELYRIKPTGADAQIAWQNKLSSCWVDNLLTCPEFRRYCLPFESSAGLKEQEPGLVIQFSTTIDFARNVFGWPLAGNDHAFDSSHYATKISKLGVKFIGYNNTTNNVVALANEPRIYLIPVGKDVMRSPGSNGGVLLSYNVIDQVVPLPFPLGNSSFDDPDWMSIYDAYTGNGDPLATIRRYPSLRAYHDHGNFSEGDMLSSTRLVGRSVWNTRWLLIIPAGTLNADRDFALKTLIQGADLNQDGKIDQPGIQDIQIGFETYSNSGN